MVWCQLTLAFHPVVLVLCKRLILALQTLARDKYLEVRAESKTSLFINCIYKLSVSVHYDVVIVLTIV